VSPFWNRACTCVLHCNRRCVSPYILRFILFSPPPIFKVPFFHCILYTSYQVFLRSAKFRHFWRNAVLHYFHQLTSISIGGFLNNIYFLTPAVCAILPSTLITGRRNIFFLPVLEFRRQYSITAEH